MGIIPEQSSASKLAKAENFATTNTKKTLTRAALPARPEGCKHPLLTDGAGGPRFRRCGKPRCCTGCRSLWAWKRALCLMKSFVTLPPTHFATIQPTLGMGNSAFLKATVKFLRALKYRALKRRVKFAYLISREYVKGALHCHGLLRAGRMPRRMVRESKTVARVRVSMKPVRNVIGAAKYVVKDTRNPFKKPELAPPGRTRLLLVSRGFLSASWKVLWQQIQAERAARPEGQVRHV